MGRPSDYDEAVAEEICLDIATSTVSLETICERDDFPDVRTVYRWLMRHDEFRQQYTRAKELQVQVMADQILPIADTTQTGIKRKITDAGEEITEGDMIEHRKLQIDSRKWLLAKLMPKKYGDKLSTELSGPDGGAIPVSLEIDL